MASVHLAYPSGAGDGSRVFAVKRLHAHLTGDRVVRAMFIDEARLASRVCHPNVVPPVEVVAEEDEVSLVMEYVHGESLARLEDEAASRGQPIPWPIVSAIVTSALRGLHAAHEARSETGEPLKMV